MQRSASYLYVQGNEVETSTLLVDRMDISPWLLQLACFRLHRHKGASSEVVVVGSIVRYATHAIRCHHCKHFTTVGERDAKRYRRTRSRVGRPRLARTAGVLLRLDLVQQETSQVSVTSMGKNGNGSIPCG